MMDYEVRTAILLDTGFDDRECNCFMFDGRKREIADEIWSVIKSDKRLSEYITDDLEVQFHGYKVRVGYTFSCNDENEKDAESFAESCTHDIQDKLKELGYEVKRITCIASEMDMGWLDRLEQMWFG
ncbi:hypothetical protein [Hungatella hathewayi]